MTKTRINVVNAVLLAGMWAFVFVMYGRLPEQIPQHIGFGGEVTTWTARDSGMWFLMPVLMTTNLLVLYALAYGMTSAQGINVPQKKRLLALPREAQAWAMQPARLFMLLMATWLIVLTGLIQGMIYAAAIDAAAARSALMAVVLFVSLLPLGGVWWLSRAIGRRVDAAEAARGAGTAG